MAVVSCTLRPMTPADLTAVAALENAAFADPWSKQALAEELALANRRYVVAVEAGDTLAGYAGLMLIGEDAHILTMAVAPALRRRGLGTRLMVWLVDAALAGGARHLTLEVRVSNTAAQALYRRFGFEPVGVRRRYYRDEDALIMWAVDADAEQNRRRLQAIAEGAG